MSKKVLPFAIIVLVIITFVSACSKPELTASANITPLATSTPSITPPPILTATSTYLPITPALSGTQAPNSGNIISVENADRLTLFARWGNGNASDAQYTPDGEYLVIAYSTGIYFYSAKDYSFVKYIDLGAAIFAIAITRDGQKMAAVSFNNVFIFNRGENKPTITIEETAASLAFSPSGQILALGTYSWPADSAMLPDGIKLFDTTTGKMIMKFTDSGWAKTLTFSPDGTRIAAGGYDATQIWSLDGEKLDATRGYVSSFSPDSTLLAVGGATENYLHVWRILANGRLVIFRVISLGNHSMIPIVFEVAISPDGKRLAAATSDGLLVWQLSSGALIYHKNDAEKNSIRYEGVTWSPDSDSLAALSEERGIEIWNMKNGDLSTTFNNLTGIITNMAWQPAGEMIASATYSGLVFLIDAHNGNISNTFSSDFLGSFAFSPNGEWLAIKSDPFTKDSGVVIYKLSDNTYHHLLEGSYGDGLSNESFSQDGKYLLTSGFENGWRIIQVWNTQSWSLYKTWAVSDNLVGQLIFCPDGKTIALVESKNSPIEFYSIADGSLTMNITLDKTRLNLIAFSPDGNKLLMSSREYDNASNSTRSILRMWQAGTNNLLYSIKDILGRKMLSRYHTDVSSPIAWSPNGKVFAVGFSDGIVEVLRASDGTLLQTISGHTMEVTSIAFSPNGQFLASASLDGTIRIWGIK